VGTSRVATLSAIDDNNVYYNKVVGLPNSHPRKQEMLKWCDGFEAKILKHIDHREKAIKDLMAKVNDMKSQQVAFCAANDKTKEIHQERRSTVQEIAASVKRHVDFRVETMEADGSMLGGLA
jgi:hypothetical protein